MHRPAYASLKILSKQTRTWMQQTPTWCETALQSSVGGKNLKRLLYIRALFFSLKSHEIFCDLLTPLSHPHPSFKLKLHNRQHIMHTVDLRGRLYMQTEYIVLHAIHYCMENKTTKIQFWFIIYLTRMTPSKIKNVFSSPRQAAATEKLNKRMQDKRRTLNITSNVCRRQPG